MLSRITSENPYHALGGGGMWLPTTIRHSFHFKLEKPDNPHFECEKPDNLNFKLEKPDHFRAGSGIVPFELESHIYINCIKTGCTLMKIGVHRDDMCSLRTETPVVYERQLS